MLDLFSSELITTTKKQFDEEKFMTVSLFLMSQTLPYI